MKLVALLAFAAAGASAPAVKLADRSPLVVSGSGFEAHASVRVTVSAPHVKVAKTVHAGADGRFRARWAFTVGRCSGVTMVARSAKTHAFLAVTRGPGCPSTGDPIDP